MSDNFPLDEFDPGKALIEPTDILHPHPDMPEHCILTLHHGQLEKIAKLPDVEELFQLRSCMGVHPIYVIKHNAQRIALAHPGLGAPLAVGLTEEIIARGGRKFIVTGTCGVLDGDIVKGCPILIKSALRDEGTSYHYQPPARFAHATESVTTALRDQLTASQTPFVEGAAWTTDAFYRETPAKIARRRDEGCRVVEMECAALFALAAFRQAQIGAVLWAADDVTGQAWQTRGDHKPLVAPDALLEVILDATSAF